MIKTILGFWPEKEKATTLDSATKRGILKWLQQSVSRSFRAHNHKLVRKFERALLEFRKGNYEEAKWCMEEIHLVLETMHKYDRLTRAQSIEKQILTIWLKQLKKLK